MKKIILAFGILLSASISWSQSITANEFPAIDDTLMMWGVTDTSNISNPSSGSGQVWDYTGIKLNKSQNISYKFILPSKATNGSKFTGSNIASVDPTTPTTTTFYNRTSNIVEIVGVNTGTGTALPYSDKETFIKYPLNPLNGSSSDTYSGSASGFGGSSTTRDGSVATFGRGTGTLKLPSKTYNNAMLVEVQSVNADSIKSGFGSIGTKSTETRYLWFVSGTRGWVFEIKKSNTQGGFGGGVSTKNVWMKQAADFAGVGITSIENTNNIQIFPNPSHGLVTVAYQLEQADYVSLDITDLSGKMVMQQKTESKQIGTNQIQIATESFAPGIYILSVNQNKTKFIKQ